MNYRRQNETNMVAALALGVNGRVRIDASISGQTEFDGNFVAVKAISNDFTYGDGCMARRLSAPSSGDPLPQGDFDVWPGSRVVAATGSAWVYPDEPNTRTHYPPAEDESPASSPASP